jgi:hypothetical protein
MSIVITLPNKIIAVRKYMDGMLYACDNGSVYYGNNLLFTVNGILLDLIVIPTDSIYVCYISSMGETTAYAVFVSNVDSKGLETPVMKIFGKNSLNNNGGKMTYKDGFLYVALGDDGLGQQGSQNVDTMFGKILIHDISGDYPHKTSFVGMSNQVYSVGVSNPTGFCRSNDGNKLILADNTSYGQKIDTVESGRNYGWNIKKDTISCSKVNNISIPNLFPMPRFTMSNGVIHGGSSVNGYYYFVDESTNIVSILEEKGIFWKKIRTLKVNLKGMMVSGLNIIDGKVYGFGSLNGNGIVYKIN